MAGPRIRFLNLEKSTCFYRRNAKARVDVPVSMLKLGGNLNDCVCSELMYSSVAGASMLTLRGVGWSRY